MYEKRKKERNHPSISKYKTTNSVHRKHGVSLDDVV